VTASAPRVGFFGLLGNGNIGNEASMQAVLRYLQADHPEAIVDAMGKGPGRITSRYGIPAVTLNWYQRYENTASGVPAALLKLLGKVIEPFRIGAWAARHDVVIIPGMGTMEASLPLRPWNLPYSFFLLSISARLCGTKVAFVSAGASVVNKRATRILLNASASLAFYRSYRDAPSKDIMRERGVGTSRDKVFSDVVFSIPPLQCGPGDPAIVGVGVMGYHGGNDDRAHAEIIYSSYISAMKSFVRWLVDNDRSVRIIVGDENEPDKQVGDEILADIRAYRPDLDPGRVSAEYPTTFTELMHAIAPVGTMVAARYHSVICALRLGKPVISLSYAPKFAALLSTMGLAEFRQSAKSVDADLLIAQFIELDKRQDELRQAIVAGNAGYERAAAAQFAELSALLFAADGSR
jgi:polysaccharide pyruvyl transferase WcaK-like protein